jgi:peroxiredoxin
MHESTGFASNIKAVAIGVGICLVFFAGTAAARRTAAPPVARFSTPLGDRLPTLALSTIEGRPTTLAERLGGHPALIYVFGVTECASCSNLPLEFKVVQNEAPRLQTLLVGSGADFSSFAPLVRQMGLEKSALVDENRDLIRALGVPSEPAVILVDSTGRILLIDTRGASRAAQFPMGHLLSAIVDAMKPAPILR